MDKMRITLCVFALISLFEYGFSLKDDQAEEDTAFIRRIIDKIDRKLTQRNMDELLIGNLTIDLTVGSVDIRQGVIGNFSSLVLREVRAAGSRALGENRTQHYFDVAVGLSELRARAEVAVSVNPFFRWSGEVGGYTQGDSARINGSIVLGGASSKGCEAYFDDFVILKLGRFSINTSSKSLVSSLITFLAEMGVNEAFSLALPYANHLISTYYNTAAFRGFFSDLICDTFRQ